MLHFALFSGNANHSLANKIATVLGCDLNPANITQFNDSESCIEIALNRKLDIAMVIQSTSAPANQHILELCFIIDALKRAGTKEIYAVIPYLSYTRQDRYNTPFTAINLKVVAEILQNSGLKQIISLDLHTEQVQGFFNIPIINLSPKNIFIDKIKQMKIYNPVIVAPDLGAILRVKNIAQILNSEMAIVIKDRQQPFNKPIIIGNISHRNCVIIDDIVDSGKTICNAAENLNKSGARKIFAFCSHAVLTNDSIKLIQHSALEELVVTDTIENNHDFFNTNISQITVAQVFATAIQQILQI